MVIFGKGVAKQGCRVGPDPDQRLAEVRRASLSVSH